VLPGLVDLAVALREPGLTQKGSVATEGRCSGFRWCDDVSLSSKIRALLWIRLRLQR